MVLPATSGRLPIASAAAIAAPEEMHGREQYFQSVLKAAERLPKEKSERVILPTMTWAAFVHKATELYDAINATTEHELEGWTELGFHDLQWRIELPDGRRQEFR